MANSSNNYSEDQLKLIFNRVSISGIATAIAGSLWVRLCTDAISVDAGTLGTEAAYTGYVSGGIEVPATNSDWTVSGGEVKNSASIDFATATGGSETMRYVEIWKNNTSSLIADRVAQIQIDVDYDVTSGKTPKFLADNLTFTFE